MTIICDFDYTLFNSGILQKAQLQCAQRLGITPEQWREVCGRLSFRGVQTDLLVSNENYAQIAADLHYCDGEYLRADLDQLFSGECDMLFGDAIAFLDAFADHDKILLTFGDAIYQQQKIDYSGVAKYFADVFIVQRDKGFALQKIVSSQQYGQPYYFIDDKPSSFASLKEQNLPITTILLQHHESRRSVVVDINCDVVVSSLLAVRDFIGK